MRNVLVDWYGLYGCGRLWDPDPKSLSVRSWSVELPCVDCSRQTSKPHALAWLGLVARRPFRPFLWRRCQSSPPLLHVVRTAAPEVGGRVLPRGRVC